MVGFGKADSPGDSMAQTEIDLLTDRLVASFGTGSAFARIPDLDIDTAYAVVNHMRRARALRGETAVGRKIGFTNTTILARYGMAGPIWNHVYDSTVKMAGSDTTVRAVEFAEPRIEPEIVLRLGRAPEVGMDMTALLGCVDAVAHGFEIVQSVFPGWTFTPAEAVAAFGLHGALIVGPWQTISADQAGWGAALTDFTVTLFRDGVAVDTGHASHVLGGPVKALGYLVAALADRPDCPPLVAGEIITTGTLTDAWPICPGERWTTKLNGIGLDGIALRVVGS